MIVGGPKGMSSSPPSLSSSPSHSTAVEAQTAATSTVAAAESKCPFTSLLSKFLPISLTAAIADIMPTTIATRHAMDSNISGGGCPLGYGRAPTLTQTGEGRGKEGRGGSSTCPLGFGSRNYPEATTTTDPSYSSLPKMSLATLQAHAHLNLLSIKGIVYDVSAQAQKWAPLCGHDISRVLAKALEGEDLDLALVDQGLAGLSYDEILHLEKLVAAFQQAFPAVAHLPPHEHHTLFASEVGEGGRAGGKEGEENGVMLHALIEEKGSNLEHIR
ncbi:hypothetical protein VYU27_009636 [Nannochloropsis oceanica]